MNKRVVGWLFRWLKVPPAPPAGVTRSNKIIRQSTRVYWYRLSRWALSQIAAIGGILIVFNLPWLLARIDFLGISTFWDLALRLQTWAFGFLSELLIGLFNLPFDPLAPAALQLLELIGLGLIGLQAIITLVPIWLRLDYHATWTIVDDKGLQLRRGIVNVRELRTRYANIQSLTLTRNPLQTLLGLSDIEIRTAGGGQIKEGAEGEKSGRSLRLRNIEDGVAVRDHIRTRLRTYYASVAAAPDPSPDPITPPFSAAAQRLLTEARALRRVRGSLE